MNKVELIKKYVNSEKYNDFDSYLNDEIIFWVDWGEEDDAIVRYCEDLITTNTLSASMEYEGEDYMLTITYKNEAFKEKITDRDPTLILLNKIIQPDYEIRFCKYSDGSDTLAFLPLAKEEWLALENEFGKEKLDTLFEVINENSQMFSKECDFDFE